MIEQLNDIKIILFTSAISGSAGYITIHYMDNMYLNLFLGTFITITIYVSLQYMFNKNLFIQIVKLKEKSRLRKNRNESLRSLKIT